MIDLDLLLTHLRHDPSVWAFLAIAAGMVTATYTVLALWLAITTPKDTPDE